MTGNRPVVFLDVDGTIATAVDPASDFSDPRVDWVTDGDLASVTTRPSPTGSTSWPHCQKSAG